MEDKSASISVILADDHTIVRAGIRQILEYSGDIGVGGEAENGLAAQQLIQELKPDVAVLDIQMPKASGIEVTRWVRAEQLRTRILILTAYNDDPYALEVLKAGANGFVLKTADPEDLIRAVRDIHAGKSTLGASLVTRIFTKIQNADQTSPIESLSGRELEILQLVAKGLTNKAIATELKISDRTVQGHLARIFNKLQAASRTEAVMRAVAMGWIASDVGQIPHE